MATSSLSGPHIYADRSRFLIKAYHAKNDKQDEDGLPDFSTIRDRLKLPPISDQLPVCIVGAGMAGLYAATMLQYLGIPFQVLEAASEPNAAGRKLGGRMFTRHIGDGKWSYYASRTDVGAMRFPNTPFMKRTFRLADELKVTRLPYVMKGENTFKYYNGQRYQGESDLTGDPYKVAHYVNPGDRIPNAPLTPEDVRHYIDDALGAPECMPGRRPRPLDLFTCDPFDLDQALQELHESFDRYTMRTWLQEYYPDWTSAVINWCETIDKSTG
ncbi:hypothetical protein OBBRIDRAFT_808232, partial [Obba rivulosa]